MIDFLIIPLFLVLICMIVFVYDDHKKKLEKNINLKTQIIVINQAKSKEERLLLLEHLFNDID